MKLKTCLICLLLCLTVQGVYAQQSSGDMRPPASDPLGENFFPPELVMQHQQAIGLSEEQKNYFKTEFRKAQTRFTELQWQLQDELEKLVAVVKQDSVDESSALAQLDKVLNAEREIKRQQFALVIQIKNKLTPEQRARLMEIKSKTR
jgi:Spy/CpxP family protein refolding chaperone